MTLHSILERKYAPENTFSIAVINNTRLNTEDFINLPYAEREKIKLLKGHMLYGLHTHLVGASKYITFLRKPEDRLLSFYHYVKKRPNHRLYDSIFGKGLSFHQFVEQIDTGDVHNAQVRWISGLEHGTEAEMLERALWNIKNHFSFIGLLEHYDTSLLMLSKIYRWGIPYYTQKNTGKYNKVKQPIEKETLALIAQKNGADLKLYSLVEQEFLTEKNKIFLLDPKLSLLRYVSRFQASTKVKQLKRIFS